MRFGLVLAMLAVCLAFVKSEADTCIGYPSVVPFGGNCNGGINCQFGSYCDIKSVCNINEKVGNQCSEFQACEIGSTCKGQDDPPLYKQTCVLNAHPGQECVSYLDSNSLVATCGGLLTCDSDHTCMGGFHGDSCWKNKDCLSNICDESAHTCVGLANGKNCDDTYQCSPGSACIESKCKALQTSGVCGDDSQCAFGYACFKAKSTDADSKCYEKESKEAGTYCESGVECVSKRCIDGYCASKNAVFCTDNSQCSTDQFCNCNGNIYSDGIGKCVDFPCAKLRDDFETCINTNCFPVAENPFGSFNFYYNGSCTLNNCKKEVDQFMLCSDASGLIASLFSAALAAFFVSFFSKKI